MSMPVTVITIGAVVDDGELIGKMTALAPTTLVGTHV
jgi:hypothetical protein